MVEFITKMMMVGLDGTEGTEENCASASCAIIDFGAESKIKVWKSSAEPHKDGFVFISIEFVGVTMHEQFCAQRDEEITSNFLGFLAKWGYNPKPLYRSQGQYWTKNT